MIINWDTSIEDLVLGCDKAVEIAYRYKLNLIACGEPLWVTLGEAVQQQKIENPDKLLDDLISACEKK
ncbi:MAG: hypothetical protein APR63_07785 [Desulfuromonas sp. SDB]|nr:MAG: hypothetical protein APR63_07785 [Desulfuromonas sp. SDB]